MSLSSKIVHLLLPNGLYSKYNDFWKITSKQLTTLRKAEWLHCFLSYYLYIHLLQLRILVVGFYPKLDNPLYKIIDQPLSLLSPHISLPLELAVLAVLASFNFLTQHWQLFFNIPKKSFISFLDNLVINNYRQFMVSNRQSFRQKSCSTVWHFSQPLKPFFSLAIQTRVKLAAVFKISEYLFLFITSFLNYLTIAAIPILASIFWYQRGLPYCLIGLIDYLVTRHYLLYALIFVWFLATTIHFVGIFCLMCARDLAHQHPVWFPSNLKRRRMSLRHTLNLSGHLGRYQWEHVQLVRLVMNLNKSVSLMICMFVLPTTLLNVYMAVYIYFIPVPWYEFFYLAIAVILQIAMALYFILPLSYVSHELHSGQWIATFQYSLPLSLFRRKLKLMSYFELIHRMDNRIGFTFGSIALMSKKGVLQFIGLYCTYVMFIANLITTNSEPQIEV